jgi:hypothetical protein
LAADEVEQLEQAIDLNEVDRVIARFDSPKGRASARP